MVIKTKEDFAKELDGVVYRRVPILSDTAKSVAKENNLEDYICEALVFDLKYL